MDVTDTSRNLRKIHKHSLGLCHEEVKAINSKEASEFKNHLKSLITLFLNSLLTIGFNRQEIERNEKVKELPKKQSVLATCQRHHGQKVVGSNPAKQGSKDSPCTVTNGLQSVIMAKYT